MIWQDENRLQKETYTPMDPPSPDADTAFLRRSPHEASGLEGGFIPYIWLSVMSCSFYPYVSGVLASSDARLFFMFLPAEVLNAAERAPFTVYGKLEMDLMDVYGHSMQAHQSFADPRLRDLTAHQEYMDWYVEKTSERIAELLAINDSEERFIMTLTLNRIAVDTRFVATSEIPYLAKVFFFGILDKWANLLVQAGHTTDNEATVWKTFLTHEFYQNVVRGHVDAIPGLAGNEVARTAEWIYKELRDNGPTPDIMRGLRNSYHGYGIRKARELLSHSGEFHNDAPSLAIVLWQVFLANGLRKGLGAGL
jgi:hypothetical protein